MFGDGDETIFLALIGPHNASQGVTTLIDAALKTHGFYCLPTRTGDAAWYREPQPNLPKPYYLLRNCSATEPSDVQFLQLLTWSTGSILELRSCQTVFVVVTYAEGLTKQSQLLLQCCVQEMIQPILIINMLDQPNFESIPHEQFYSRMDDIVQQVNSFLSQYSYCDQKFFTVNPVEGTVLFASGYDQWMFSAHQFSQMYSERFGVSSSKLVKKFWGNHYFDRVSKKYKVGDQQPNAFCEFVLRPLQVIMAQTINNGYGHLLQRYLTVIKVGLSQEEQEMMGRSLYKAVMSKWLSVANTLFQTCQLYLGVTKHERLLKISRGSVRLSADRTIIDSGHLIAQVIKTCPGRNRVYLFVRIYAGRVSTGQRIRVHSEQDEIHDIAMFHSGQYHSITQPWTGTTAFLLLRRIKFIAPGTTIVSPDIDDEIQLNSTDQLEPRFRSPQEARLSPRFHFSDISISTK